MAFCRRVQQALNLQESVAPAEGEETADPDAAPAPSPFEGLVLVVDCFLEVVRRSEDPAFTRRCGTGKHRAQLFIGGRFQPAVIANIDVASDAQQVSLYDAALLQYSYERLYC